MENNPTDNIETQVTVSKGWRRKRRVLRWVARLLLFLLFLALLPVVLFQIPAVQNFAAQKLTHFLSNEWETDVSVKKVYLGLFYEVNLSELYVEDLMGDTLVYAGELDVDHDGLLDLLSREFTIESLVLRNAILKPKLVDGQENFQFLLNYFSNKKKDEKDPDQSPFLLNIKGVLLENVHLFRPDDQKNETLDLHLDRLIARFDLFDLPGKKIDLSSLQIQSPDFRLEQSARKTAAPAPAQEAKPEPVAIENLDTNRLAIRIEDFRISDGKFHFRNFKGGTERTSPADQLDFDFLNVMDINLQFNGFTMTEDLEFSGEVVGISMRDTTGFVLENLSAKQATLTCEGLELLGMELRTPHSLLGDTLIFRYDGYPAWDEFEDEVKLDLRFNENARLALRDILLFAPALQRNVFFAENKEEVVRLQGRFKGPVNRLDGRNLVIDIAEGVHIEGNFSTLNLAVPDEQFLHLELDRLLTTVATLRKLIPGFSPPENVSRLGNLDFSGKFDGFFVDFVADGKLRTDIGSASMFMNMKLPQGRKNARYSGDLALHNFDLGAWSGNRDLGKITFVASVKEGVGLTLDLASAKLEGRIDSLRFKGYDYVNVNLNGQLEKNRFRGKAAIDDKNMDLDFEGELNFTDSVPEYIFKADIRQLALMPLNLSTKNLQFSGKVDTMNLRGTRLSNIVGNAQVSGFQVVKNGMDTLRVNQALATSTISASGEKQFKVSSNLGNVDIDGFFDIEKIPNKFTEFVTKHYPGFADRMGLVLGEASPDTMQFKYKVELFELQNLTSFFEENIRGFDKSLLSGSYDGFTNKMTMEVEVPEWSYGNITFEDVYFNTDLNADEGRLTLGVIKTRIGENNELAPVQIIGTVYGDTLEYLISSLSFFKILDNLNINGMLTLEGDDAWRVSFKQSDLVILNQTWRVNTSNFIRIGKGSVETQDFELYNGNQVISLNSVRGEGLALEIKNVPLRDQEFVKNLGKLKFDGVADLKAKAKDVFRFEGLEALLRIDSFTVNGDHYGTLRLDASATSVKESISTFLTLEGDSTSLTLDGYYNPPTMVQTKERKWRSTVPNFFDLHVSFAKMPTRIIQYFVADISKVQGSVNADNVHFFGTLDKPEMDGFASVENVQFTIKALQTAYRVPLDSIRLSSRWVDASGVVVFDKWGHRAKLEGGLIHDHFKNWGVDLYIRTMDAAGFLALETTERDNPVFYDTALGAGLARFTGSFKQPELEVFGRSTDGTHMYLPLTGATASTGTGFINFTEDLLKSGGKDTLLPTELRGLDMDFTLDITEEAVMEIIFDKTWGDVMKGRGTANGMKVIMQRDGNFSINGTYTVVQGDYLFTLMNLGLNKPFTIDPGGTVTWSGDPYGAIIDIKAIYSGVKTSMSGFIGEFLAVASDNAQQLARNSTPVSLTMGLTGELLKPDIQFDIAFPDLPSELRGFAENKLQTIRQDPNELNRQVFGLLILGQFMPSGYTLQADVVGLNTLSEMLSNQLSIYVTEFVSELLVGTDFIQGIDLDLAYNRYSGTENIGTNAAFYTGDELTFKGSITLTNRWSVSGGVNVGVGNSGLTANSGQTNGDFQIEYAITADRRLKVKAYRSTEPDIAGGRRAKTGAGLSFRKEFDSLEELMRRK